jgi:hypothetical protein
MSSSLALLSAGARSGSSVFWAVDACSGAGKHRGCGLPGAHPKLSPAQQLPPHPPFRPTPAKLPGVGCCGLLGVPSTPAFGWCGLAGCRQAGDASLGGDPALHGRGGKTRGMNTTCAALVHLGCVSTVRSGPSASWNGDRAVSTPSMSHIAAATCGVAAGSLPRLLLQRVVAGPAPRQTLVRATAALLAPLHRGAAAPRSARCYASAAEASAAHGQPAAGDKKRVVFCGTPEVGGGRKQQCACSALRRRCRPAAGGGFQHKPLSSAPPRGSLDLRAGCGAGAEAAAQRRSPDRFHL